MSNASIAFTEWRETETDTLISEKKKEELYAYAYTLYQKKRYQEATFLFRLLVEKFPSEGKLWKGLGSSLQMEQDYEGALDCYCCFAKVCDKEQLTPSLFVHTADCHFALKQVEAGLKALEAAQTAAKKSGDKEVLQHVSFMKNIWKAG